MPVTFAINSKNYYDSICISYTNSGYTMEYAYHVSNTTTGNILYTYVRKVTSFQEVLEYLENVGACIDMDTHKPATVDIQLDGFPCTIIAAKDFTPTVKSAAFQKCLTASLTFMKV